MGQGGYLYRFDKAGDWCAAGFRPGLRQLRVITGIPLPPPIVRFVQLRTSGYIGFAQLCAKSGCEQPQ
jgi:hypothetical protein